MMTDPEEDYTRGFIPFLGTTIFLDSRPLIPRVETEFWTDRALHHIGLRKSYMVVLDLFAGSGAIGLAVLARTPLTHVDFGEREARHFPTILKSLEVNDIDPARARMLETDVWSGISGRYDLVLANPPYLAEGSMAVEKSVRAHEPHEALFALDDGFALVEATLRGASEHLKPGGQLWIEHDPVQTIRIHTLGSALALTTETHTDQFGVDRYTVAYCKV